MCHRLADRLRTGNISGCIEPALAGPQRGIVGAGCDTPAGRNSRLQKFCGHITAGAAAQLLNITPDATLGSLASQIVQNSAGCIAGEDFCRGRRLFPEIQRARDSGDLPVTRPTILRKGWNSRNGGFARGLFPRINAAVRHQAQIKPALFQHVRPYVRRLRRDTLIHARGRTESTRRRQRAEFKAAAVRVAARLD